MIIQNVSTSTIPQGSPVAIKSTSGFVLANATDTTLPAAGFPDSSVPAGAYGTVRTGGELSILDWTAVLGSAKLTPGSYYYLSTTAGHITATAPSTTGNLVQPIGQAIDGETLRLFAAPGTAHS